MEKVIATFNDATWMAACIAVYGGALIASECAQEAAK